MGFFFLLLLLLLLLFVLRLFSDTFDLIQLKLRGIISTSTHMHE